jgi:hypothetical protein
VFVAWEHRLIVKIARDIVAVYVGKASTVPEWKGDDFDSIYVIRIVRGATTTVSFERDYEGLNGQSAICAGRRYTISTRSYSKCPSEILRR